MNRRSAVTLAAASALAIAGLGLPQVAHAASRPHCTASASPKHPGENATVTVSVNSRVAHGHLRTIAHYKSTSTAKNATADKHGNGVTRYDISDASPGYKVKVSVTVSKGKKAASCSTSFTPS